MYDMLDNMTKKIPNLNPNAISRIAAGTVIIGGEIFGFTHLPFIFVVCTVAYVCNGNSSIYRLQKGR